MNDSSPPMERTTTAILFCGGTYFIHFLALGFASFPLQTHVRHALDPTSASIVASVIPIAACLTYFFFRLAEARGWTRSPQRVLFVVALGVGLMQAVLGWRLHSENADRWLILPVIDIALCLFFLGCVQSSCMTLLNHIGVATMGSFAYTVRAAGSAGYMSALILMGLFGNEKTSSDYHLFIGSCISVLHAVVALAACVYFETIQPRRARARTRIENCVVCDPNAPNAAASEQLVVRRPTRWDWYGLLILVWMVAACEQSYSLYSHEFLTNTYGNYGYFVFAGAVGIEIALLLTMPIFPSLKQRLLFVGPLGWIILFSGCLLATQGATAFGLCGLALALNCPFQISANEHAHRINSSILGVASMTLAQSLGYVTATIIAATVATFGTGPAPLWMTVFPFACIALILAVRKLARESQTPAPGVPTEPPVRVDATPRVVASRPSATPLAPVAVGASRR